ncbi:MAG: iron ABC transporter permease [Hyphomicrobiales bacterium]|nr:iron ABC transporter permease [Hyphomicrobiales bacterium]
MLAIGSLLTGPVFLTPPEVVTGLMGKDPSLAIIVQELRLPRVALSLGVGAILGLCGAAAQSLTRNPLAEPAIFGTPQAAAFGAVLVLYSGSASAVSLWLPLAAITAAMLSLILTVWLLRANPNIISLLLVGLGIGSLAGAATSLVISFSSNPYAIMEIVFWLMGSFEDRSVQHVLLAYPFFILSALLIFPCGRGYQALTLGEDVAWSLGFNVRRIGLLTALGIATGVGAGVAVCGAIGFVGLVAPHLVRPFCNGEPVRLLLPSMLAGAILTTMADIAVRLLPATNEIRVGVLTAFIGVPFFIYLVKNNDGFSGMHGQ